MTTLGEGANFDRIAGRYRWMEYVAFGRSLQRCREHFLPQLADRHSALVLGDGDGRFLARLLARNTRVHADAVDTSAAMLLLLRARCDAADGDAGTRLRTHWTSALAFAPSCSYDLVVSHFFLDCLTDSELNQLCARLAPHVEPGALWLASDFRIPEGAMHWPARAIVRLLYLAFRTLTGLRATELPDHAAALRSVGFEQIAQHHSLCGLLTSELWRRGEYTPAMLPEQHTPSLPDPLPDPEPASPSLPEPDPGVYHPGPEPNVPDGQADAG
jgi:SAM-dependent methyltransferase